MAEMKNKKFSEYLFCSRHPGFVKKNHQIHFTCIHLQSTSGLKRYSQAWKTFNLYSGLDVA